MVSMKSNKKLLNNLVVLIPYITTLAGAFAAKGISAYRKGKAEVRSLQSYHDTIR